MTMPEKRSCDVLVVGAGVAGIAAAVSTAREGAHTILIEKNHYPGGAAVIGMHRFICGLYANGTSMPDNTLNEGIIREICVAMEGLAPEKKALRVGRVHVLPLATRDLVTVFRSLIGAESQLDVLYTTKAVSVSMEQNSITSLTVKDMAEEFDIIPGVVIDCSGDGIIIQLSGARYQLSPRRQHQLSGFSLRVKGLQGVDEMLAVKVPYYLARAVTEKKMPFHLKFTTYSPGDDMDEGFCKLNIPPARKHRTKQARNDAFMVHQYLSQVLTQFRGSYIAEMSPEVVDREGPRVRGEYTLSAEEVVNAKKFPDGVVKNAWPIELWDQLKGPSYKYLNPGDYYEIPLRCLKAQDISNCWCAGRCISVTHEALGSTRVIGTCISLGERAGREAVQNA